MRSQAIKGGVFLSYSSKICAVLFTMFPSAAFTNETSISPLEAFKQGLSRPPIVKRMIVEKAEYPEDKRPEVVKYDNGFTLIDPKWQVYKLLWQTNGFCLEFAPEEYSRPNVQITNSSGSVKSIDLRWVCGEYEGVYWYLKPASRQVSYTYSGTEIPKTWVTELVRDREQFVTEAVQFGIRGLLPGSVVWNENRFSGIGVNGEKYIGHLSIDGAQRPLRLDYQVIGQSASYSVEYGYGDSSETVLPTRYERKIHIAGPKNKSLTEAVFVVRELTSSTAGLSVSELRLDQQLCGPETTVFTVTPEGTFYKSLTEGGMTRKVLPARPKTDPQPALSQVRRRVVLIALILSAVVAVVVARALQKTNRAHQN